MNRLSAALFLFFALAAIASAQACPGGFWGNGQCIAPCESPLVNPNVSLAFYGWQCQSQPPCENNAVYCYPSYTAYDNAYNQYCGVIIDWNDGGCTDQPPALDRFGPPTNRLRSHSIPAGLLLKAQYEAIRRSWRPGAKCLRSPKKKA